MLGIFLCVFVCWSMKIVNKNVRQKAYCVLSVYETNFGLTFQWCLHKNLPVKSLSVNIGSVGLVFVFGFLVGRKSCGGGVRLVGVTSWGFSVGLLRSAECLGPPLCLCCKPKSFWKKVRRSPENPNKSHDHYSAEFLSEIIKGIRVETNKWSSCASHTDFNLTRTGHCKRKC